MVGSASSSILCSISEILPRKFSCTIYGLIIAYRCIDDFHRDVKFVLFDEFCRISFVGGSHMVARVVQVNIKKDISFVFLLNCGPMGENMLIRYPFMLVKIFLDGGWKN